MYRLRQAATGSTALSATFSITGDHIVGEVFDGEAIIIDTVTGAYFSLAEGPANVWTALMKGHRTLSDIAEASTVAQDVVHVVLVELVNAGLVHTNASSTEVAEASDVAEVADVAPMYLTKYSDMEELLLLDPIHDVSPAGWPSSSPLAPSDQ